MEKKENKRRELQCVISPLSTLSTYKYVVICSRYAGKWLLSRHKKRDTWETQGGHIEPDGERIARRGDRGKVVKDLAARPARGVKGREGHAKVSHRFFRAYRAAGGRSTDGA